MYIVAIYLVFLSHHLNVGVPSTQARSESAPVSCSNITALHLNISKPNTSSSYHDHTRHSGCFCTACIKRDEANTERNSHAHTRTHSNVDWRAARAVDGKLVGRLVGCLVGHRFRTPNLRKRQQSIRIGYDHPTLLTPMELCSIVVPVNLN